MVSWKLLDGVDSDVLKNSDGQIWFECSCLL